MEESSEGEEMPDSTYYSSCLRMPKQSLNKMMIDSRSNKVNKSVAYEPAGRPSFAQATDKQPV